MNTCDHPNISKLKEALINGDDITGMLGNSLEQPALLLNNKIGRIKELLIANGAKNVLMSGSGSSVFAIGEDNEEINKLKDIMKNTPYYIRFTKTRAY